MIATIQGEEGELTAVNSHIGVGTAFCVRTLQCVIHKIICLI